MPPSESADAFAAVRSILESDATPMVSYVVSDNFHEALGRPTAAESFGAYVRELYDVYRRVLAAMRVRRDWCALEVHSTEHTTWCDPEFALVDEFEVCSHTFDPAALDFPWVDNTLDRPWKAWTWDVSLLPDDADDAHVFWTPHREMAVVGDGRTSRLSFFGFDPDLPRDLTWLKRV